MTRHVIVDVCPIDHPKAEWLKEENRKLGLRMFKYRGRYVIVLCEPSCWPDPENDCCQ